MGLGEMLEKMNKNRPQPGIHFNGLSPTGGDPTLNGAMKLWQAQAQAQANAQVNL